MSYLSLVFFQVVAPILVLLIIGGIMQRKFRFNLKALSNLITYCLMPAAVFVNIYKTNVNPVVLGRILIYLFAFSLSLMAISTVIGKLLHLEKKKAAIFKNSIVLINSGNYGIPVSQMVFHAQPLGIAIQIITVIFQNLTTYTYGLYNLISTTKTGWEIAKSIIKLPIVHGLILGLILNIANIQLPQFLSISIGHMADAFVAIAILTLGAQLSKIHISTMFNKMLYMSCIGRLFMGPLIAFMWITIFGFHGVVAQSLLIASAFPTSRNSSTLALEYDVEPELAAQTVLFTTIVSCITVTIVIYVAKLLYV